MTNYRFLFLAIAAMTISYAAVHWLTIRQVMPNAKMPSFHSVGASDDPRQNQPNDSEGDEVRDSLRRNLLKAADDLRENPCNDYFRDQYIAAATKYARAWLSIATCFPDCGRTGKGEQQLDRAKKAFATPLDDRVASAMNRAHDTDTIRAGDFSSDVELWVAAWSHDTALNPRASQADRNRVRASRQPLTCRP